MSGLVIAGAIDRLTAGTVAVQGLPVLVVSGIAAMVMLAGALVLGGDIDDPEDDDGDLNMQAVLLDTAADAAAAAGVAVTGAIILATRACTGSTRPPPSPSPPSSPTTPSGC